MNINPEKAIDLGCGAGRDTIYLIKNGWNVLSSISKPVDQLEVDDMTLLQIKSGDINTNEGEIYNDITLSTSSLPTTNGTHTIFVTLTLDTGEQIEYSTDVTFE